MGNIIRRVAISSLLAIAAVFLWFRRIDAPRVATAPVVIAQRDMPEGVRIDRMAVVIAQWPVGTIPPGAFKSVDSVAGRVTRATVFKGEVLVPGRLAPAGIPPGLEVRITPGKRAMSFRINDASGIAGLVPANSRVDIVLVMDGGDKGRVAKVFMENMRVLAVGWGPHQGADPRLTSSAVATVEVTPQEGEQLAMATMQGEMQLMLRGYGDRLDAAPDVDQSRLRPLAPAEATLPSPCSVQPGLIHDLLLRSCTRQRFVADSAANDSSSSSRRRPDGMP